MRIELNSQSKVILVSKAEGACRENHHPLIVQDVPEH